MVNVRSCPISSADALYYDMSLDEELDSFILPLLNGLHEEPLEENSFLAAMFSDCLNEPLPESQKQVCVVKESKITTVLPSAYHRQNSSLTSCTKATNQLQMQHLQHNCNKRTVNGQYKRLSQLNTPCQSTVPSSRSSPANSSFLQNCAEIRKPDKISPQGDKYTSETISASIQNPLTTSPTMLKASGKNVGFVLETFSPRETNQVTSRSQLECDLEENDTIPVVLDIKNLRGVYQKKTRKTGLGFEHRLVNSKVNMTVTAQAQIRCIKCYVRRCREAAKRTHDTIGPVELEVTFDDHEPNRTHFTVDLDSVYMTPSGDMVYWLEKAEVEERNKWELIVTIEFIDGTEGNFYSKPFQIRTKSGRLGRACDEDEASSQRITQWIGSQINDNTPSSSLTSSCSSSPVHSVFSSTPDGEERDRMFDVILERAGLNGDKNQCRTGQEAGPRTMGRVIFCHDSTLDMHAVAQYYNRDNRLCGAIEQPDVRGMLKLVGRKTAGQGERRRANGFRAAEEEFWWSCGVCFFERKKKSTVKAHVEQKVCQKTSERKEAKRKQGNGTTDGDFEVFTKRPCRSSCSS